MIDPEVARITLLRDGAVAQRNAVARRCAELSESLGDGVAELVEKERLDQLSADITMFNDEIARRTQPRAEPEAPGVLSHTRLSILVRRQDESRQEREALVAARESIQRLADEDGRADLDVDEDRRFRDLTREIAELDGEVVARDEEIDKLAALAALGPEA